MKRFIARLGLFLTGIALFITAIIIWKGNGRIGYHYARFASPIQYSLICGTSMAAQDVVPEVLDSCLTGVFMGPFYNYSFAINSSPWGEQYCRSILKKFRRNVNRASLFVFGVDPFSLGFFLNDDSSGFRREKSTVVGKMKTVCGPMINIEHMVRYDLGDKNFYKLQKTGNYIDKHGRYISTLPDNEDTLFVHNRLYGDVLPDYYKNYLPRYRPSMDRLQDLSDLIDICSESGRVFLVRFPVRSEINHIMDSVWVDFDSTISEFAARKGCRYINFHEDTTYKTTDGVHLYSSEAMRFSQALGDSIKICLK